MVDPPPTPVFADMPDELVFGTSACMDISFQVSNESSLNSLLLESMFAKKLLIVGLGGSPFINICSFKGLDLSTLVTLDVSHI